MASHANISSTGTIENLLNLGFTLYDYLNELNDNALDAGAKTILLRLDTVTRTLTLSDDGKGMDKADLTAALCINNTKPASDAIGLRGLGLKAGLVGLSGGRTVTLILSKKKGCEACEVEADWPKAMRDNLWNPSPAYLSRHYGDVWDRNKLNDEHGTIIRITLPEETFQGLLKPELLAELGRTYETRIRGGVTFQVAVDGVVEFPTMARAVGYADAVYRAETPIRLMRNPATGEMRAYLLHRSFRPIWTDWVRINPADDKKKLRDMEAAEAAGFMCEGEFTLQSVYNPAWNPPVAEGDERRPECDGYIAPCRDGRFLRPIKTQFPSSGDYQKRRMYACTRHALNFTHQVDTHIGVQVNKSAVTPEKINPLLWAAVNRVITDWVAKLYKDLREAPGANPDAEFELWLKRTRTRVRAIALVERERFLAELEHFLDDWDDDEEDA
jgi:hypothetical protein